MIKREFHGMSQTTEYKIWHNMIQHCTNPNSPKWEWYGGRGITVCERWRNSFVDFLTDVGRKPSPELTLDRIDNNGNYEPGNWRWATIEQQRWNQQRKAEGVSKHGNKHIARLTVNYKRIYLGSFQTKEEALSIRHSAEIVYRSEV